LADGPIESDETLGDYFAKLNLEGERRVWVENRGKINYVFKRIERYLKPSGCVCEVGVGEGYLLRLLCKRGLKVVGVDRSKYLVNKLKQKFESEGLDIELINADISNADLGEEKFDAFFCFDVLEHIANIEAAIRTIKKGLVNGGLLVGTLPFREILDDDMIICPNCKIKFHRMGHCHSFSTFEEVKQLLGAEFEIVRMGEVVVFKDVFDMLVSIVRKVSSATGLRRKKPTTIYFAATISK
jgi:2-polyprenyl-3-methyl-5-hydroxy-6-metoxy-1,4-benzoquinol methylase